MIWHWISAPLQYNTLILAVERDLKPIQVGKHTMY